MIVKGALRAVPGATDAGISLVHRRGRIVTFAPSSRRVAELDELQAGLGEGPCVDSILDETQVSVPDLATEHARWPPLRAGRAGAADASNAGLPALRRPRQRRRTQPVRRHAIRL